MNSRDLRFLALLLVLVALPCAGWSQTISLVPDQIPNGIEKDSDRQYHQRFEITLTGSPAAQSRAFTITLPPELEFVSNSVTATSYSTGVSAFYVGQGASSSELVFGLTLTAGSLSGEKVAVEFDVTTPTDFAGIGDGAKQDTVYALDFAPATNLTDTDVSVSKHQNRRIQVISFTAPDSSLGDTTGGGGRFYKLKFPSALPDLSHTDLSGLSASAGYSDGRTDVVYSFYWAADSSLVNQRQGGTRAGLATLRADGSGPLLGTRQDPRTVPATFIRESYTTTFFTDAADSVNGVISLAGTQDDTYHYIYVLADPAPARLPSSRPNFGAPAKKGYDETQVGTFSGGTYLGRSGPLLVRHPPEFVVVGWDYDIDNGDDFDNTGVVQVPSDIIGMASVDANRKDNRNITLDTGSFVERGDAFPGVNSNLPPDATDRVDLLFQAQDDDNAFAYQMAIFLATRDGLTEDDLVGGGIDSLSGATKIAGTDTLTINHRTFSFSPIVTDSVTGLAVSFIPAGSYRVYFAATDGDYRTVSQVLNDPFIASPTGAQLTVRHSPTITPDVYSLNDFDGSGDGDLDVVTGIDVSQMMVDGDGRDLGIGPSQRYVTISWASQGANGDVDVDDSATIELYYSTRSNFKDSRGSVAYTSGDSQGDDLLNELGKSDTHLIGSVAEDPDGLFDNQLVWDLWTYVSAETTIPKTGVRYYLYALLKQSGSDIKRLFSLTRDGALDNTGTSMGVNFRHPPFLRPIEPSRDMTVSVDEPVVVTWEAADVDNAEGLGTGIGRSWSRGQGSSPNVRILLSSVDFGEVSTWGTITNTAQTHRFWVGNSGDGSLAEEVALHEAVDSSFVMVGNRMRNNLFSASGLGGSSGDLELQTNAGLGETYTLYLAIDDGRDGSVGDAVVASVPQLTNFGAYSPVVRVPGRVTFVGTVPASPPTSSRFIVPTRMETTTDEPIKYPIFPEVTPVGKRIRVVDVFLSVDADKFAPIDMDPANEGIQPFSIGDNGQISASNIDQGAYVEGDKLRLDLIYSDQVVGGGLTFFDGEQALATANLRALSVSDSPTVHTTITLDDTGQRVTKMLDDSNVSINAAVPAPTQVTVNRRGNLSGRVPLQSRDSSADTVTFYLRGVGSYSTIVDSLFETNDLDPVTPGVQVVTTEKDGKFTLNHVPSGRYVLVAYAPRYLAGHDTVYVKRSLDAVEVTPTLDGDGVQRTYLLAGDAAGYIDSTGTTLPDNYVGSDDINAVNDALFTQDGDSLYNTYADFNRDGVINATDKDYAAANQTDNTGAAGEIRPVFPNFKLTSGTNTEAVVRFSHLPDDEIHPGETFDVTVEIDGARAVRTYEVHILYDPERLKVEDLVSAGSLLSNYLTDVTARVTDGDLGLVNSIIGRTPIGASGGGSLATVRFRAISRSAETRLALSEALLIDVEHVGLL